MSASPRKPSCFTSKSQSGMIRTAPAGAERPGRRAGAVPTNERAVSDWGDSRPCLGPGRRLDVVLEARDLAIPHPLHMDEGRVEGDAVLGLAPEPSDHHDIFPGVDELFRVGA